MPAAIKSIVSAYVRLENRRALEDMRELRRHLLGTLEATSRIDPAQSRDSVLEDLRVIEDGLQQLPAPPATTPENEGR